MRAAGHHLRKNANRPLRSGRGDGRSTQPVGPCAVADAVSTHSRTACRRQTTSGSDRRQKTTSRRSSAGCSRQGPAPVTHRRAGRRQVTGTSRMSRAASRWRLPGGNGDRLVERRADGHGDRFGGPPVGDHLDALEAPATIRRPAARPALEEGRRPPLRRRTGDSTTPLAGSTETSTSTPSAVRIGDVQPVRLLVHA